MASQTSFSGLPVPPEILVLILSHLSVSDFIALTSVSKDLRSVYYEPTFWKKRSLLDFRLPPQPFFEENGKHWQWVYKSLKTRSTVYTWGKGEHGNLGRRWRRDDVRKEWPGTMLGIERAGAIADVQCGGWSTVLLNTQGSLFAAGTINNQVTARRLANETDGEDDASFVIPISMPFNPGQEEFLDVSYRAIKQFSMGRARLLALSDEDEIIEWTDDYALAGDILTIDAQQDGKKHASDPKATQVVAGWEHGSAYFPSRGLYYWLDAGDKPEGTEINQILAFQGSVHRVPGTKWVARPVEDSIEDRMGTLKKYLVLEHHIIMLTDGGRLFSWEMSPTFTSREADIEDWQPTELTHLCLEHTHSSLIDIQGSFRRFAVFHKDGSVQICSLDEIDIPNTPRFGVDNDTPVPIQPEIPSVLQDGSVIQLAFGDYHYHALHRDGTITSHGTDPDSIGALGLGSRVMSFLRGVHAQPREDGRLLIHPESDGRRTVWFEPEKFVYLATMWDKFMEELRTDSLVKDMAHRAVSAFRETYGEFFEHEGRNWSSGPDRPVTASQTDKGSMEPYFALKVAAAGWSGAAVVLVDEARAEEVRQKYLLPPQPGKSKTDQTGWASGLWSRARGAAMGVLTNDQPPLQSDEVKSYIWSEQKFPLLRMPGYRIEEEKLTSWKDGEPAWLLRSGD